MRRGIVFCYSDSDGISVACYVRSAEKGNGMLFTDVAFRRAGYHSMAEVFKVVEDELRSAYFIYPSMIAFFVSEDCQSYFNGESVADSNTTDVDGQVMNRSISVLAAGNMDARMQAMENDVEGTNELRQLSFKRNREGWLLPPNPVMSGELYLVGCNAIHGEGQFSIPFVIDSTTYSLIVSVSSSGSGSSMVEVVLSLFHQSSFSIIGRIELDDSLKSDDFPLHLLFVWFNRRTSSVVFRFLNTSTHLTKECAYGLRSRACSGGLSQQLSGYLERPQRHIPSDPAHTLAQGAAFVLYYGSLNTRNEAEGFGVGFDADGTVVYHGGFAQNQYCGKGWLLNPRGFPRHALEGQFWRGIPYGRVQVSDVLTKAVVARGVVDSYADGVWEGELFFLDRVVFRGVLVNGVPTRGEFYYLSGALKYVGAMANGKAHGKGCLYYDTEVGMPKKWYEGGFVDGVMEGKGRYYSKDRDNTLVYSGSFVQNRFHGSGELSREGTGSSEATGFCSQSERVYVNADAPSESIGDFAGDISPVRLSPRDSTHSALGECKSFSSVYYSDNEWVCLLDSYSAGWKTLRLEVGITDDTTESTVALAHDIMFEFVSW